MPTVETRFTANTKGIEAGAKRAEAAVKAAGRAGRVAGAEAGAGAMDAAAKWHAAGARIAVIGQRIAMIGAGVTAALFAGMRAAGNYAEEIETFANALGMTEEDARAVQVILAEAGIKMQAFGAAAFAVSQKLQQAREEGGDAAETFRRLGIDVADPRWRDAPMVEVIAEISRGLAKITNQQERLRLQNILGLSARTARAAALITPEALAGAKERPEFISEEEFQRLIAFDAAIDRLSTSLRLGFFKALGESGAPLQEFAEKVGGIVGRLVEWANNNPWLVEQMIKLGVALGPVALVGGNVARVFDLLVRLRPGVLAFFAETAAGANAAAAGGLTAMEAKLSSISRLLAAVGIGAWLGKTVASWGERLAAARLDEGELQRARRQLRRSLETGRRGTGEPLTPEEMARAKTSLEWLDRADALRRGAPVSPIPSPPPIQVNVTGPSRKEIEERTRRFARDVARAYVY